MILAKDPQHLAHDDYVYSPEGEAVNNDLGKVKDHDSFSLMNGLFEIRFAAHLRRARDVSKVDIESGFYDNVGIDRMIPGDL